jgi:hypothetical protein
MQELKATQGSKQRVKRTNSRDRGRRMISDQKPVRVVGTILPESDILSMLQKANGTF